jgi:hypothetical protein
MKNKRNKVNELNLNEIAQQPLSLSGWRNQDNGQISFNTFRVSVSKQNTLFNKTQFNFSPIKTHPNFAEIPYSVPRSNYTPGNFLLPNMSIRIFKTKKESTSIRSKHKGSTLKEKLASLNKVCGILEQIFSGKIIHLDHFELKLYESSLIHCVMKLSFSKMFKHYEKTKKPNKVMTVKNIRNYLEKVDILQLCSDTLRKDFFLVKRKEENLKFIMKNTIKYFRKQFFKNYGYKTSMEHEIEFLNFYFKNHIETYKAPVNVFSDPLNNTMVKNPKYKTLSNEYLARVFGISLFKNMFYFHLEN